MIRILLPLLALLLQAPAVPQAPASIRGYILKMGTGEPVSKAAVTLTRTDGNRATYAATTGVDGQFIFQNLQPGQYRLSATRNGFVRSEYGARTPNKPGLPISLTAGQKLTDIGVQIMQAGTIAGRIFDRDGEPLANVTVQGLKYSYQDGQRVLNAVQTARTNDLGEYRLFWLQPGQYFVNATYNGAPGAGGRNAVAAIAQALDSIIGAAGGRGGGGGNRGGGGGGGRGAGGQRGGEPAAGVPVGNADEQPDEGFIPIYYPGSTQAESAAPINLPAGTIFSGVDVTVAAVRTLRVRGQAINAATGQPARNANIALIPRGRVEFGNGMLNFRTRSINDQGGFEIRGVVPGSYDLVGTVNDRTSRLSGRVPIDVGGSDVQNVTLVIAPGFAISGRLSIEGQTAGAGQSTAATAQNAPRVRVNLRPIGGALRAAGAPSNSQVQADGTFTLQQVEQGDYRLGVNGMPRNGYLKTARFGSTDVLAEGLRVDRQPNGVLDIVIGTDTGALDGTVSNDKQEPSVNVTVVLAPDATHRQRSDLYRNVSTDALGRFHLEGVPPGDYKLFAWEDVESGAWQDSEFMRPFEERGKPVRISTAGAASADLRVIP